MKGIFNKKEFERNECGALSSNQKVNCSSKVVGGVGGCSTVRKTQHESLEEGVGS